MSEPTTAQAGNPKEASRGAAVKRAKAALGDAIEVRLALDFDLIAFDLLGKVIGCERDEVKARLDIATLADLESWTKAIDATSVHAAITIAPRFPMPSLSRPQPVEAVK